MSGGFGILVRRDSGKFAKKFLKTVEIDRVSQVKKSLPSIRLKFEIKVLLDISRYLRDFHYFFGFPILSEIFSLKESCFFVAMSFFSCVGIVPTQQRTGFIFWNNSLSMWCLDFTIKPLVGISFQSFSFIRGNFANNSHNFLKEIRVHCIDSQSIN